MFTQTIIFLVCVRSIQDVCWRGRMCPASLSDYADKRRGLLLVLGEMPTRNGVSRWSSMLTGQCQRDYISLVFTVAVLTSRCSSAAHYVERRCL